MLWGRLLMGREAGQAYSVLYASSVQQLQLPERLSKTSLLPSRRRRHAPRHGGVGL